MNAKLRKEINKREAYEVLKILKENGYWDPVVTAFMTENQCSNNLINSVRNYFKKNQILMHWNKNSYIDGIANNKEIAPMMQHYEFSKFQEELEG